MSVKQRLIEFLKYKNIGQAAFEKNVGLSNGYVNNIRQSIQPDKIQKIALKYPELNTGWLMTGNGEMLNWPDNLEKPKVNEQVYYGGGEAETVSMPREVFNQISKLTETILSQQRVIESQNGTIETLIENGKKTVARMEDNATNADVKKASGA